MSSFSDCEIEDDEDKCFKVKTDNPGEYIREIVEENKSPKIEGMPPFSGHIKQALYGIRMRAESQEQTG